MDATTRSPFNLRDHTTQSLFVLPELTYKVSDMSASTQTDADTAMSISKYTLPPPIYLPSSGGYTSSRLASEVSSLWVLVRTDMRLTLLWPSPSTDASSRFAGTAPTKTGGWSQGPGEMLATRTYTRFFTVYVAHLTTRTSAVRSHTNAHKIR